MLTVSQAPFQDFTSINAFSPHYKLRKQSLINLYFAAAVVQSLSCV